MAGEDGDSIDLTDTSHEPRECMPCRGTGKVISHLGGVESVLGCPWCGGTGVRVAGIDAQSHWLAQREEQPGAAEPAGAGTEAEAAAAPDAAEH